jgi:hypothetical protein
LNNIVTIVLIFITMFTHLQAQDILGISYDISIPTLDTKEFVSNTSLVGFGLDARKMTHGKYSYGVTFHWNSFTDDRLERLNTGDGNTVTIDDRSMESFPLLLNSHYYFFSDIESFRPFFGGNIGTYFIITRRVVDGVKRSDTAWHFGLAPDIGFMFHFMDDVHVMLTLRYNYAFKTGGSPAQTYFSILFGFVSVSLF